MKSSTLDFAAKIITFLTAIIGLITFVIKSSTEKDYLALKVLSGAFIILSALLLLIVIIRNFLLRKAPPRPLRILPGTFLVLAVSVMPFVVIKKLFFSPNPPTPPSCWLELYNQLPPDGSLIELGYSPGYATITDTINIDACKITDLRAFRLKHIQDALRRDDSLLIAKGFTIQYAEKLYPYFVDTDSASKKVVDMLKTDDVLKLSEVPDSVSHTYTLRISLQGKNKPYQIDSIIDATVIPICLAQTITDGVMVPLEKYGHVTIYIEQLFIDLCATCKQDLTLRYWQKRKTAGGNISDSAYFDRGYYSLSPITQDILGSLKNRLRQETSGNYTVVFTGFTDSIPVSTNGISYSDGGLIASNGDTLPPAPNVYNHVAVRPLSVIKNNDELAFARAYSCYKFMNDAAYHTSFKFYYTGEGVDNEPAKTDRDKRAVKIFIQLKK